jgi:hypothetical protein
MTAFRRRPWSGLKTRAQRALLRWRMAQLAWGLLRWLQLQVRKLHLRLLTRSATFRLSKWYGRTGNNIQQLIVVIAHAEAFRGSLQVEDAFLRSGGLRHLVSAFSLDFSAESIRSWTPDPSRTTLLSGVFFHYTEHAFSHANHQRMVFAKGDVPRRDSLLGRQYIHREAHRIARTHLLPHIRTPDAGVFRGADLENTLVIHLRGGDVADLDNWYYITNPLHFYRTLSLEHRRVIVVREPGCRHPLLDSVLSLFEEREVVQGSVDEDFQLLRHARHLASSGVGTFALAAVLLSESIRRFHCTDVFLIEHLNPRMLDPDRVTVQMLRLPGYAEAWRRSSDRLELLLQWRPPRATGAAPRLNAVPGDGDPP